MENKEEVYNKALEKKYKPWAIILSIIVPLAVIGLFSIKIKGVDLSFLPPIYASINATVAILLVLAVIAIKNKKRALHERLIKFAVLGSALFLIGYIAYHITSDTTYYGDVNKDGILSDTERDALSASAMIYYIILFTHIILSVFIIPLVCFTFLRGLSGNFVKHKYLAQYTFPLWLYVAITGPIIYLMISPYYV